MSKKRIDNWLVEKALVPTRSQARALIMAGKVLVNDEVVDKAGTLVSEVAVIRLKDVSRYVGRGGFKLEKALQEFQLNVTGKTCLDVGLSTGGFTDCLLQNGAIKVYGVDSGDNQIHWRLKTDARVVSFENSNFRHFDLALIADPIDVVVMDVSFISIKLLLPKIVELFRRDKGERTLVSLIKPQFEAGKGQVGKGGIVRDEAVRAKVVEDIQAALMDHGFQGLRVTESPITGSDGNVEYLIVGTFVS